MLVLRFRLHTTLAACSAGCLHACGLQQISRCVASAALARAACRLHSPHPGVSHVVLRSALSSSAPLPYCEAAHTRRLPSRCPFPADALCFPRNLRPAPGPWFSVAHPRLDAQTTFAKLFADIGSTNDMRAADLPAFLAMAHLRRQRSRPAHPRTYELKRFAMLLPHRPHLRRPFWLLQIFWTR